MEVIDLRCRRTEERRSCGALRGSASALDHGDRIDGDPAIPAVNHYISHNPCGSGSLPRRGLIGSPQGWRKTRHRCTTLPARESARPGAAPGNNRMARASARARAGRTVVGRFPAAIACVGWSSASGLEQSEQLQVGDVFDDDRRRDLRDVVVGADFRFLHRSTESVGRRKRSANRL